MNSDVIFLILVFKKRITNLETTLVKNINFYLFHKVQTALSIFNLHGQNILQTTQHYSRGTNQLKVFSDQLPNGIYLSGSYTKRCSYPQDDNSQVMV